MSASDLSEAGRGQHDNPAFDDISPDQPPTPPPAYKTAVDDGVEKPPLEPMQEQLHPDDFEDKPVPGDAFSRKVASVQKTIVDFYNRHETTITRACLLAVLILYLAYFCFAMYYRFGDEGSIRLLVITGLVKLWLLVKVVLNVIENHDSHLPRCCETWPPEKRKRVERIVGIVLVVCLVVALLGYIIVDVALRQPLNLVSLGGLVLYVVICFIFSYSPAHVRWRPVLAGLVLQLLFALLILRTRPGFYLFQFMGDRVAEFLQHTDAGSKFLFGDLNTNFAFGVLPVVIFFSTAISVTYYLGVMQVIILNLAYFMQIFMGTTAAESVNAAANIFIGQSEAPLVIRPLVPQMTRSELHAVMTGGFATIAGSLLAAYISFGVPANHLLGASVMSAPAALAMSKLFYPETQKSKTTAKNIKNLLQKSPERNILEAASNGASASIKLVANIAVNLVAFLAILQFVDTTLIWCGHRVGVSDLTFGLVCSYMFFPLALMMGVAPENCRKVAELIGIKTFLNEFVAYEKLGVVVKNKAIFQQHLAANGTYVVNQLGDYILQHSSNTTTLVGGVLTERSEVIATYALCGFANFGSIGVMLGALSVMAPSRKADLSAVVLRAMIAGNVACFMTACIAGLMYEPSFK